MFYGCSSLEYLPDISKWNINNFSKISNFQEKCKSISYKVDQIFEILKDNGIVINISYLFYECSSLKELPDISKWNTFLVKDMSYLFYGCSSLNELPDISKWNTILVTNISYLFYECSSLNELPDISKWNTNLIMDISYLFMDVH